MARTERDDGRAAARAWLRRQTRVGAKAGRPVVVLGLLGVVAAIGQAFCAARVLGVALAGFGLAVVPVVAFAVLALARAA
ncbi:MAG: thiol reductant ABC exporter subunit CydD, partial [Acetobacteraceae bacterium]